ncbi:unnamed protein product [Phytomonas sp. Hart1]|nr:unnamed protein product [Phytomonas sp. Hart1]|eukprot:CCW71520.1 unnamed protein product [Phytomonas sp. isolate Hart1]
MPKLRAAPSKRVSSKKRHKIERKKREHKRDLRKAAKGLKKKGLGPNRNKKSHELAKLALKVSNVHPDKEAILNQVLKARENLRVMKKERRKASNEDCNQPQAIDTGAKPSNRREVLFIPTAKSNDFKFQFLRSLSSLVFPSSYNGNIECSSFEVPSAAYIITLDSRFSVQAVPWTLIDSIIAAANSYRGGRKVLILFVLTKTDLVSSQAIVTQVCLLATSLKARYPQGFGNNLVWTITPFSVRDERTGRHLLRILYQFRQSEGCCSKKMRSNLDNKICTFVIGFPCTGRRSLCRALASEGNATSVSVVPMKAAQLQTTKSYSDDVKDDLHIKFAFPNAKAVTLIQLPEDIKVRKELQNITGGDVFFRPVAFIDKVSEPEVIGCVLFENILDKLSLSQAFCQPLPTSFQNASSSHKNDFIVAKRFLLDLGRTVRHVKGFYVSPLFVMGSGTMGKLSSSSLTANAVFTSAQDRSRDTLLDATYSNATPNKLVRISSVQTRMHGSRKGNLIVRRVDTHNVLRLGSRTFIRELWQGKYAPWAVMRFPDKQAITLEQVSDASEIFNIALCGGHKMDSVDECKGEKHLNGLIQELSKILKDILPFLPNIVIEMDPNCILPPQYDLDEDSYDEEEESEYLKDRKEGACNDSASETDGDTDASE